MSRFLARMWPLLLALVLAMPASAEVFRVKLTNGSVIETAYQPQQASWDPGMVLLLSEVGNWIGFPKDEIENIEAEDPTQGFGIRISDKTISLGFAPNDLPEETARSREDQANDRYYQLAERALALSEKQQNYSIQQGVSTEQTQGIPAGFGGVDYSGGSSGGNFGGGGLGGGAVRQTAPTLAAPAPVPPSAPRDGDGNNNG